MSKNKMEDVKNDEPNKFAKTDDELKLRCYICHNSLTCPLQLCSEGHCACAECIALQLAKTQLKPVCFLNVDCVVTCIIAGSRQISCGICKEKNDPKFPGSFFVDLMLGAKSQNLNCPFCNCKFPLKHLGVHILKCDYQKIECTYCTKSMQIRAFDKHFKEECDQLPCLECKNLKMNGKSLMDHAKKHKEVDKMCTLLFNLSQSPAFKQFAFANVEQYSTAVTSLSNLVGTPLTFNNDASDSDSSDSGLEDGEFD